MKHHHEVPAPPELRERDGISYALFVPSEPATGGVVVCHGAGSAKESHYDFGRVCRMSGLAALCFDARGHGESTGAFGASAVGDVLAMADVLGEHAPVIGLRGSSLGGMLAIEAAAAEPSIRAVAAICPAPGDLVALGLESGRLIDFRTDGEATIDWLRGLDLTAAAASLAGRTALLLLHARGDEQVPVQVSEELHAAAGEPKRLIAFPGGHHRSLQHDLEVQNVTVQWLRRAFAAR